MEPHGWTWNEFYLEISEGRSEEPAEKNALFTKSWKHKRLLDKGRNCPATWYFFHVFPSLVCLVRPSFVRSCHTPDCLRLCLIVSTPVLVLVFILSLFQVVSIVLCLQFWSAFASWFCIPAFATEPSVYRTLSLLKPFLDLVHLSELIYTWQEQSGKKPNLVLHFAYFKAPALVQTFSKGVETIRWWQTSGQLYRPEKDVMHNEGRRDQPTSRPPTPPSIALINLLLTAAWNLPVQK